MSRFLDVGARDEKEGVALGKGSASWVEDASADASIASAGASGTTPTAVDASSAVGASIAPAGPGISSATSHSTEGSPVPVNDSDR